ncbi:alpha/beta hydrolase [Anaerocolumna sp. AGMB13025]|uniref:alpha/beta fold hydrolase n=1 Tax=Anaerocolumna sp. AGMB13025 TaxID=3039116 RepID=UPI00241CCFB9|nr:alpha/beta hydrolase [Anaerocolumna sp. AGMB13025]WFR56590.1 alpha/beta hydrolase [Anaerocolumna sp. AGMB13025]
MMKVYRSEKAANKIRSTYDELLKQWGIPVKELMVPTMYGSTHIIITGKEDGKPLLMFHGVGDDSALMWIYNAKALGEYYKLYAIDTIGGPGKSLMGEKYNTSYDDVIWIDEIMNYFNLEKSSIIGVSHGGYLVQLYSLYRQEKIDKAISVSSSVPIDGSGSYLKTMMKIFLPEALFPTKKNVIRLLRKLSGSHVDVFTHNGIILKHYQWLLKGFNNMAMRYHKVRMFTEDEVEQIKDKIYYLVGLEDPFQKLGGAALLRKYNMNVKFYDGVGHGINHEIAEIINNEVIQIMEGKAAF